MGRRARLDRLEQTSAADKFAEPLQHRVGEVRFNFRALLLEATSTTVSFGHALLSDNDGGSGQNTSFGEMLARHDADLHRKIDRWSKTPP